MSKVLVFTTYNATPSNPNMYEFVEKNNCFLCDVFDEVCYLNVINRANNNNYFGYLKNTIELYNSNTIVSELNINIDGVFNDFLSQERINPTKLQELYKYIPEIEEFDAFYTFGNFVTFNLNNDSNKSELGFKELTKYNFDMSVPYYLNFLVVNELLKLSNLKKIQFFSDPLDIPFTNFTQCTPDTKNKDVFEEFLPLYQYYYNEVNKSSNNGLKTNKFIMGNSCGDEYRKYLFDRYVLAFYEHHKDDDKYKFYASGYKNHKIVLDNFIDHNVFYDEIEKSMFGLVLNTYSKDFISANKISMMLSRNCLPIITEGSDSKSEYIPSHIREQISVKSSIDLEKIIHSDIDVQGLINELKDFYKEDYLEIIKGVFL